MNYNENGKLKGNINGRHFISGIFQKYLATSKKSYVILITITFWGFNSYV